MRTYFPHLAGNRKLAEQLGRDLSEGRFSHAAILEGPRGSGKHTLAREIAMAAACERRGDESVPLPCGNCPTCRKIASGNCPDLLWFSKPAGKVTTGVDTVRALREGIAVVPNDLDLKIYVIEDAHTMTVQAQNAFLLTLEEPPAFVLFILLTEDAGALLETVRSRAPIYRLSPVPEKELSDYLTEKSAAAPAARALAAASPEEFAALIKLSGGAIGIAEELLNEKKRAPLLERRSHATELLTFLAGRKNGDFLLLIQSLATTREEAVGELSMLSIALRDLILLTRSETPPLLFFTDREKAADLSARFPAARLFRFSEHLDEAMDALAANANLKLTFSRLADRMMGE